MTNWNVVFETGEFNALTEFANGQLSCENVQKVFRNQYPEASAELRNLIRTKGTAYARRLTRKALKRRVLV